MSSPEIEMARDQVLQTRAELSSTLNELSARISEPVTAVKQKLNVVDTVRENPWVALAVAVGAGVFVATSGADARAANAAKAGARAAKGAGEAAMSSARTAPSAAKSGVGLAVDALATNLALSFINGLRKPTSSPEAQLPSTALGMVRSTTPAHEEPDPLPPEASV